MITEKIKSVASQYPQINLLYTETDKRDRRRFDLIQRTDSTGKERMFIANNIRFRSECTLFDIRAFEDKGGDITKPPYDLIGNVYTLPDKQVWYKLDFGIGMGINAGCRIDCGDIKTMWIHPNEALDIMYTLNLM